MQQVIDMEMLYRNDGGHGQPRLPLMIYMYGVLCRDENLNLYKRLFFFRNLQNELVLKRGEGFRIVTWQPAPLFSHTPKNSRGHLLGTCWSSMGWAMGTVTHTQRTNEDWVNFSHGTLRQINGSPQVFTLSQFVKVNF